MLQTDWTIMNVGTGTYWWVSVKVQGHVATLMLSTCPEGEKLEGHRQIKIKGTIDYERLSIGERIMAKIVGRGRGIADAITKLLNSVPGERPSIDQAWEEHILQKILEDARARHMTVRRQYER